MQALIRKGVASAQLALLLSVVAGLPGPAPAAEPARAAEAAVPATIESAVVKVFATTLQPDLYRPWSKPAPAEVSGSGVVIDGRRVLTNAHVVAYASEVQIQGSQGGDRISAKVSFAAPDIDLAVLTLDDESFFRSHAPIARSSALPTSKDPVLVYGYPTGGQSLSVTKGIVSRTEFVSYNYPVSGLRVQIDAAINPGNSGGPAVAGDRMFGLARSRLGNAENIGYIIPGEEIELFLKDIADGHYDGKPAMLDEWHTLENPALRSFLKLGAETRGIVVHRPYRDDPGYPLRKWDVITKIGDTPIDDQGQVTINPSLRVAFTYLVQQVASHGLLPLSIIRDGKPLEIRLPVSPDNPTLLRDLKGDYPPYFIYGPLVFSVATQQLANALLARAEWVSALSYTRSPLLTERFTLPGRERDELVIVASPLFPHKLGKGYASHAGAVLDAVNGTKIRSLQHLVAVLRDLKDDAVVFDFAGRGIESLVFPRADLLAATETILSDNGIRAQGSPDLLAVWQARVER